MTARSVKRPNGFFLALGALMSGAGLASWFVLLHFITKWWKSGPKAPEGDYIYAHVEHGGATYFNAMQSTATHLIYPVLGFAMAGLLIANAAYGIFFFGRRSLGPADWPLFALQLAGAVIAVASIFFCGHDILSALINSPFGPSSDDLTGITAD